jgi:hypothetical protein
MLSAMYPEKEWSPSKFSKCPFDTHAPHFWESHTNQRMFLEWAGKQLGIKELSDWYNVTKKVV